MIRVVFHIDMDAFFAAIEERDNPRFRGQPIVVGADPIAGRGRGVVSTANYEARKYGIRSALPISVAYRLCPTAVFLPVDGKRYQRVSKHVMDIIRKYGEKMEQVSVDEAYLEVKSKTQNAKRNYRYAKQIAQEIKRKIWQKERLTCSIGIGPNKLIAKIASGHQKPDGLTVVRPEEAQGFLDPKPAGVLPGIGPKTYSLLQEKWGIVTVFDLRKIKEAELIGVFGKNGIWIRQAARGIDDRPIEEEREIKSIGRQTTFSVDTNDSRIILDAIFGLLQGIFDELNQKNLKGKTLTIIIRYAGFETHTSQESAKNDLTLETAKKLCLKLLMPYFEKRRKVRLVGVRVSGF